MPTTARTAAPEAGRVASWTFLTNHAHVLLCLAGDPELRVRDIAERVGVTERAVLRILGDLAEAGYLARERAGRRTHYRIHLDRPMRHPVEAMRSVRVLVEALADVPGMVDGRVARLAHEPGRHEDV